MLNIDLSKQRVERIIYRSKKGISCTKQETMLSEKNTGKTYKAIL
jgi:hypothetical protein